MNQHSEPFRNSHPSSRSSHPSHQSRATDPPRSSPTPTPPATTDDPQTPSTPDTTARPRPTSPPTLPAHPLPPITPSTPSAPMTPATPTTVPAPRSAPGIIPTDARPSPAPDSQVTLRSAAELADALPYLMGFYPDDSIVLVALHGECGRFGGRVRLGIPTDTTQWPSVADQLAECLISAGEKRGPRPDGMLVFLCQEPAQGERGQDVKDRLRPLAQRLRLACGALEVPVLEALCLSNGRYWSYCCPDYRCCPAEGTPMVLPGTSVMAAAATYAGVQVRGSLKDMEARLAPRTGPRGTDQVKALDAAAAALLPRMLQEAGATAVRHETIDRALALIHRFRKDTPTGSNRARDACDDALLTDDEAAVLILGLQDRVTRDQAAEWMEGPVAAPALRLWRALARRCSGSYVEYAAAPLTLAGWIAWATGDEPSARVALSRALAIDPGYLFAQLLHQGINDGLDPEPLRRCLREERNDRTGATAREATGNPPPKTRPQASPTTKPSPQPTAEPASQATGTCRTSRPSATGRPPKPRGSTRPGSRTTGARPQGRSGHGSDRSRK